MAFTQLKLFTRHDRNGSLLKTAVVVSCGLHLVCFIALSQYWPRQSLPRPTVYQPPLLVQLQALKEPMTPKLATPIKSASTSAMAKVLPKPTLPRPKSSPTHLSPQAILSKPAKAAVSEPHSRPQVNQAPVRSSVPDLSMSQLLDQARQIGGDNNDPSPVGLSQAIFGQTAKGIVWDAYVDGWQRKVERIGQANYPGGILPNDMQGVLTLSVIINQNGSLASVRVLRSSGLSKLDQAAMDIVKQAAPYAPFPPHLAQSFQTLEIKRRWRFSGNQAFQ